MEPITLELRDIHLPEPIGWWPPAPGWWWSGLLLLLVVLMIWWSMRIWRRRAALRAARKLLAELRQGYLEHGDPHLLLVQGSQLLRRVLRHAYPHEGIEALTGREWLARLDRESGDDSYSNGVGVVLEQGPYQRQVDYDAEALLTLFSQTVTRVMKVGR